MKDSILKKELLNEREVAYLLGISPHTLQKKRRTGNFIPFRKIGSSVRYLKTDVEIYLQQQRFTSTSEYGGGNA